MEDELDRDGPLVPVIGIRGPDGTELTGGFIFTVLDVGCIECGETTVVRGCFTDFEPADRAWNLERRRLELVNVGELGGAASPEGWARFVAAGGSLLMRWGHYRSPETDGHRSLQLLIGRVDP